MSSSSFSFSLFLVAGLLCVISAAALVAVSEHLNAFCAQNWESLTTQNYFDEHGTFLASIYSAPLLVAEFIIVVSMYCFV
jgi:hypothetical protein